MPLDDKRINQLKSHYSKSIQRLVSSPGGTANRMGVDRSISIEGLAEKCFEFREQLDKVPAPPIRILHHFACTGGTLISKNLQVQPNITLLSEIDPLSSIPLASKGSKFLPSDLVYHARDGLRQIDDEVAIEMFLEAMGVLHRHLSSIGQALVVRVHSHSQFCTMTQWASRVSVADMLRRKFQVLQTLTVRHPLDSWLSLNSMGWKHFEPYTLDEYCIRYAAFLDENQEISIFNYENFVASPNKVMSQICETLALPMSEDWIDLSSVVSLSGDSGRSGQVIEPRTRRMLPDGVASSASESANYAKLCDRLGYAHECE
jgi:hypothetical protein